MIQGGRCNSFASAQIEPRMVPWTVHRAIDHQTFGQWPAVMRARSADGEKVVTSSGHKNRFVKCVSQKHFSIAHASGLIAFFKIRSLKLAGSFSHRISFFVLTYESHPIDPITVSELFNIPNGRGQTFLWSAKNTRASLRIFEE
jgi:hypothetical protein